ncbi:MAG: lipid-A-disaccharide synthase-related protein [Cyanobacteria bacterium P01_D01_bin.105]
MAQKLLYISNGHGEDNHSSHIIRTLQAIRPELKIAALPIVGHGNDYQKIGVPIIGPTYLVPSGGFTFMNRLKLIEDIRAGLLTMTWKQYQAMKQYVKAEQIDFVAATGDAVGQTFAWLSGKPFVSFISPLSSTYEGTLKTDFVLRNAIRSDRCKAVFTRDADTATDLTQQGFQKIHFGGIPALDRLQPTGKDLQLTATDVMIGLLPGSRPPEAVGNLQLEMQLSLEIAQLDSSIKFRAALVPNVFEEVVTAATNPSWMPDWQLEHQQAKTNTNQANWIKLSYAGTDHYPQGTEVLCYRDAFSDIAYRTNLVLGMAGLAVNHAMAIGKPIVQIAGPGPQFTYAFAEAQQRLLGLSVQTIGTVPATSAILKEAAKCAVKTLQDKTYLEACVENGRQRFGPFGASTRIANSILHHMDGVISADQASAKTT